MRRFLFLLLLLPAVSQAQVAVGGTGWTCTTYLTTADFNAVALTIDSGSNRALVIVHTQQFSEITEFNIDTVGGQAPTAVDEYDATSENPALGFHVWGESAIAAMSGSSTATSGAGGQDVRVCYVTLTGVDQTALASYTNTHETETTAATIAVTTTSTANDYVAVICVRDTTTGTYDGWDTLTEIDEANNNSGGRQGLGAGAGGDATTTVTLDASDDVACISGVFTLAQDGALYRRRR